MAESQDHEGSAPPRSLFADDSLPSTTPNISHPQPGNVSRPQPKVFTRVVLPAVVLVIGIACIAWVAQYLPSRRGNPVTASRSAVANPVQFNPSKFVWEP